MPSLPTVTWTSLPSLSAADWSMLYVFGTVVLLLPSTTIFEKFLKEILKLHDFLNPWFECASLIFDVHKLLEDQSKVPIKNYIYYQLILHNQ